MKIFFYLITLHCWNISISTFNIQQTFISLFEKQFREITNMTTDVSSTVLSRQISYAGQHYTMENTTSEV